MDSFTSSFTESESRLRRQPALFFVCMSKIRLTRKVDFTRF